MPTMFWRRGNLSWVSSFHFHRDFHRFGEAFKPEGEEEFAKLQLKELKNGRLAMIAIMGQLIQEGLTKQ